MADSITFSFGENWKSYLETISEDDIRSSMQDIEAWLGEGIVKGKDVLDIGSGSGLHSLAFYLLGAKSVRSIDVDPNSVEATRSLWEKSEKSDNWRVEHASILDDAFVKTLDDYDIVYSWGVLHHTGDMWKAIDNTFDLVRQNGHLWISLYAKGRRYPKHLALKQKYNAASDFGKSWMVNLRIAGKMVGRLFRGKNPFIWNRTRARGMNVYHDLVDWLGGLPYEVATPDEVVVRARPHGFVLERIKVAREGGCSIYVLSKHAAE